MGRTIFVGDIHGCAREFDDLLTRLRYAQGVDRLILVGDLVARGPDSASVVELARSSGAVAVRGNHDEKVLSWWRVLESHSRREADRTVRLSERHRQVVTTLKERHFVFLERLPLMLTVPDHGAMVVHAGVDPTRQPIESSDEVLLTVRSMEEGKPSRKLAGTPWARLWQGPAHIVFGHDARRNLQLEPFATGLDTGCCYGRSLTALVLDAGEPVPVEVEARRARLASVIARQSYCPMGSGDAPE